MTTEERSAEWTRGSCAGPAPGKRPRSAICGLVMGMWHEAAPEILVQPLLSDVDLGIPGAGSLADQPGPGTDGTIEATILQAPTRLPLFRGSEISSPA